jgi:hypothetical protein
MAGFLFNQPKKTFSRQQMFLYFKTSVYISIYFNIALYSENKRYVLLKKQQHFFTERTYCCNQSIYSIYPCSVLIGTYIHNMYVHVYICNPTMSSKRSKMIICESNLRTHLIYGHNFSESKYQNDCVENYQRCNLVWLCCARLDISYLRSCKFYLHFVQTRNEYSLYLATTSVIIGKNILLLLNVAKRDKSFSQQIR